MAEKLTLTYTTAGDYTLSDATKIEITGGVARLKDLGGATYSTDNPTALYNTVTNANNIIALREYATKPTNTEIKYTLYVDSLDQYHNGTDWVSSDGTYSQSNTMAEIIAAAHRLKIDNFQLRAFLNTTDAAARPLLDRVEIFYDDLPQKSESYNYNHNVTRNEILQESYMAVGALAAGNNLTNEQYSRGNRLINGLLSSWRAKGIPVWNEKKIVIPIHDGIEVLGSDGVDWECIETHISNTNTVPVTGKEHMAFWRQLTTTAGATHVLDKKYTSSNQYELPSEVFSIEGAYMRKGNELTPITLISREDYRNELQVDSTGQPTRLYFRRDFLPEIQILPFPDSLTNYVLELDVLTYTQDLDSGSDTVDLTAEWNLAVTYAVALLLAPSRGLSGKQYSMIKDLAKEHMDNAMEANRESGDLYIMPGRPSINDRQSY